MATFELQFGTGAPRLLAVAPDASTLEHWRTERGLTCEIHAASAEGAAERTPDLVLDEHGQPHQPAEVLEAQWLVKLQPWRATPITTAIRRVAGALVYLLFASVFVALFIVFPRGQRESGLLPPTYLSIISLIVFGWILDRATGARRWERAALKLLGVCPALALGWLAFSAVCPLGWSIPHPLQPYAVVRRMGEDGSVKEDELYRRNAPIVHRLAVPPATPGNQPDEPMPADSDTRQVAHGYRYSARYGLLIREYLGEDEGKPNLTYECRPPLSLAFCPRIVCETFAFTTINLFPLLLLGAWLMYQRERRQTLAAGLRSAWPPERLSLARCLWLAPPFVLGLAPLAFP